MAPAITDRPVTIQRRDELDDVLGSHDRVLVMVRTAGCAVCQSMEPILDAVARSTEIAVVEFNPKDDLDAVAEYNVRSVPTFLLFDAGELIDRRADGFIPAADLIDFVETA